MKKLILLTFILFLGGCGRNSTEPYSPSKGKKKVLSSTAIIGSLVGALCGKEVDHSSLIKGNIDPHNYELVKGDDEKILSANIIFYNGLGLEHGASIQKHFALHPCAIPLGESLFKKNQDRMIYVNGQIDPHIWMDISLFSELIEPIVDKLKEIEPKYSKLFDNRASEIKQKMLAKDRELQLIAKTLPNEQRFLVTSHDAFHYFVRKYLAYPGELEWTERLIAPEGISPDGQLGVEDIRRVVNFLSKHDVRVVFPECNLSQDPLKKVVDICRKKGFSVTLSNIPLYGDTMGQQEEDNIESYLKMVEHNVKTLIESLSHNDGNRRTTAHGKL